MRLFPRSLSTEPGTSGQSALSTIFIIGGIIMLYGVSLAAITLSFLNSAYGFQAANRAFAVAESGVADAGIQLMRNKDFADSGYCVPAASVPCPAGYAEVIVTQATPAAGQVTVTSDAMVNRRRRKLQAVFNVSTSTGAVSLAKMEQVTF